MWKDIGVNAIFCTIVTITTCPEMSIYLHEYIPSPQSLMIFLFGETAELLLFHDQFLKYMETTIRTTVNKEKAKQIETEQMRLTMPIPTISLQKVSDVSIIFRFLSPTILIRTIINYPIFINNFFRPFQVFASFLKSQQRQKFGYINNYLKKKIKIKIEC